MQLELFNQIIVKARFCKECGDEIESARLKAQPNTYNCIYCQSRIEKTGRFKRHTMAYDVQLKAGEIESTETHLVRGDD